MGEIYLWQQMYLAAICETDDARVDGRILEARSAIEERLLSPIKNRELELIQTAAQALETLRGARARQAKS
jgi:hypothetical protein